MAQPDLRFYFSIDNPRAIALAYEAANAANSVFSVPVYAERELINIIGYAGAEILVLTEKGSRVINGGISTACYIFNFGTFVTQHSDVAKVSKPTSSSPVLQSNTISAATITSGNRDFLGAQGYVVAVSNETQVVEVLVYLTNREEKK